MDPEHGLTFYFTDGTYLKVPTPPEVTTEIVKWYRDAKSDQVFTLNNANGVWYMQKRHITRIVSQ